jgi:polysaccharide biosynthesis protein PslJ
MKGLLAGVARGRLIEWDAVTLLSVFLAVLWLIQARWVVGPLGGVGTPAILVGLTAAAWRLTGSVEPRLGFSPGWQPVRLMLLVQFSYHTLTYGLARLRPLTDLEASGSTRAMITLAALTGIALVAADGIRSLERLEVLLRRAVWLGTVVAMLGLIQFFLEIDLVASMRWPLLSQNADLGGMQARSIFARPDGTALHPIEFGAVLSMVLPFSLHYYFAAATKKERIAFGVATGLLGLGIAASMSRTGILGAAIVIMMLSFLWSWRLRVNIAILTVGAVAATWVLVPGLVGTIRRMFVGARDDPSVQARIERIPIVRDLINDAPLMGRGFGTFSVDDYLLLDNQVYQTAIESGYIGLVIVALTFVVAIGTARGARYRGRDAATRHLAQAVAASILVAMVATATFDAFFYRIYLGMTFLLIGCAGALWRLEGPPAWARDLSLRRREVPWSDVPAGR